MTGAVPAVEQLLALPESERLAELRKLVASEFRVTLLLDEDEEVPLDRSYFDLGLTSLRLTEIKRRLDRLFAISISANTMFNEPTVEQLVGHLAEELFGSAPEQVESETATDDRALLDDIFKDLYES